MKWLKSKLKCVLELINPFYTSTPHLDRFVKTVKDIHDDIKSVQKDLKYEKELLQKELKRKDALLNAIIECIPDMIWCKDLEGKYVLANKAIRDGLLFDNNPVGKTDAELSKAEKKRVGDKNHTFGQVCGNSDEVVMKTKLPQRFLENGLIKGKNLELEVHKNVICVDGEVIGTVGIGRDITDYVEALDKTLGCGECPLKNVFDIHRFKEGDNE